MKKVVLVLSGIVMLAVLLCAVVFVGADWLGKPKMPTEILAAAAENMDDVGSMRFEMNLNMELLVLEEALSLHTSSHGEMTAEPPVVHGTVTTEFSGEAPETQEVYLETKDGETVMHIGTAANGAESWITQSGQAPSGGMQIWEMATVSAAAEPETVSETEILISGEIPAEQVMGAMQATGMLLQNAEVLMPEGAGPVPIRIRVDTERLIVTGYELDLTDMMQPVLTETVQKRLDESGLEFAATDVMEVVQVRADAKFLDFDQVEQIVIPE